MQIPETSLIPATISLISFFKSYGLSSFYQNYPYWYFGEVPYRYLIGPITPFLFQNDVLLSNLMYFIPLFILISAVGWSLFFQSFFKQKKFGVWVLAFSIYLLLPWKYLYGFAISDFTSFFAKSLIPFFLIFLYKKKYILSVLFLALMLLINTSVLPSLFVFSVALILKDYKSRLKPLLSIFISSYFISLFWYGPMYYLRILMNPSIGGRVGLSVVFGVFNFFKLLLPVVIAFVVVKFSVKLKKRLPIFITASLLSFGILTFYRFIANPEFFMDWTAWLWEVETCISLLLTYVVYKKRYKYLLLALLPLMFAVIIASKLKLEPSSELEILKYMDKIVVPGDRVFLSGSTVFLAGVNTNLVQLRGGRDEVIKNKDWLEASYIFRESQDIDLITQNLRLLDIKYVLVHTGTSKEYFKDFKNEHLWSQIGTLVSEDNGDKIYRID